MKKKILLRVKCSEKIVKPLLDEFKDDFDIDWVNESIIPEERAKGVHAVIGLLRPWHINTLLRQNAPLEWIQYWSAGVNDLPLDRLRDKNITITSVKGIHGKSIAETVVASMISRERHFLKLFRQQEAHFWKKDFEQGEIHGKTVGILGMGATGKEVARVLKLGFNMTVWGMRTEKKPTEYVDYMVTSDEVDELYANCDYIVNILPATEKTFHFVDAKSFSKMKKNAMYIAVGRGDTTDEKALIDALRQEVIAFAALDVFETEPLSSSSPLWDMPNVIVLPHQAGLFHDYFKEAIKVSIENLRDYRDKGTPSLNVIDYNKGY